MRTSRLAATEAGTEPDGLLADRDLHPVEPALDALRGLFRRYFRVDVQGMERIPAAGPALLVANHSGGGWSPDAAAFVLEFLDRFGIDRPFHFLGHATLMRTPVVGPALRRFGVIPASRANAREAFEAGACVMVFPGGEVELHRPFRARNEIRFQGRTGFLEMARDTGVPLVPIVMAGGQQTYLPITDGRRLAEITGFRRLFGVKVLPVAAGVPFGLTIGNLAGWIPLPARLSIEVLDPVDVRRFRDLGDAYRHVTGVMQATLTRLTDGL